MPTAGVNVPVSAVCPAEVNWLPWVPVSDAPRPSTTSIVGTAARNRSLMPGDNAAPPETVMSNEDNV